MRSNDPRIPRIPRIPRFVAAIGVIIALALASSPGAASRKELVAHRGASAYAPEHTIEAYRLAMRQGADFVEQDLAVTKDGVLVCMHDLTLERTTDVEQVFPDRFIEEIEKKEGKDEKGGTTPARRWLVHDFTLAEIKRLDAGSWFDKRFAGARVPTFQEAIDLVRGRAGLYPELKDPEFYRARGVTPETLLADLLRKNSLVNVATVATVATVAKASKNAKDGGTPVIIQSFDDTTLKRLAQDLPQVPRVFLVEARAADRLDSADKVRAIAVWATGLGPNKAIVEARPELVAWAHAAGLTVTPWTFRASSTGAFRSVGDEMAKFLYEYGVDALFTDNPDQFPRR